MKFRFVKSHSLSRMRTRGSSIDATRSRVSSSDFPTFTTTSSHSSRTDVTAGTMGKSSFTALRTMVKPEIISGPELQVVEPAIQAVVLQQGLVAPPLDDAPLGEHDDEVGVLHGGEPVRDHEHRPALHQPADRLLDQALRFGVESARRLVEDE